MNISDENIAFNKLTHAYITEAMHRAGSTSFIGVHLTYKEDEILYFGIHHANCGENVIIVGIDPITIKQEIPDTLEVYDAWENFIFKSHKHCLIINVSNRSANAGLSFNDLMNQLPHDFESLVYITTINTLK